MLRQFKNSKFYLMILADLFFFSASLIIAYLLRLDFTLTSLHSGQIRTLLPLFLTFKLVTFIAFGLYRGMWRYTGLKDILGLLYASLLSSMIITSWLVFLNRFGDYSRGIIIIDCLLTFLFTSGFRVMIRMGFVYRSRDTSISKLWRPRKCDGKGRRVMIVGAGDAGEKILREISGSRNFRYQVVCFLDDASGKQHQTIHGLPVFGPIETLPEVVKSQSIQEILIAIPSATGTQMRRIVELCEACDVTFKTLPSLGSIIDGRVSVRALRHVDYEDLLGRPPVNLDNAEIAACLQGRRILVTGCGGSIGSELCRQIIKFQPSQLILWESSEPSLYQIQMELHHEWKFHDYVPILGQIQQAGLLDRVFHQYQPEVVFHAAAYKHVPLLEQNPWNAVLNNIEASELLMKAAIRHGVVRFVLVSTDKAVRPTNVMGASKRTIEIILQSLNGGPTHFMAVRFGNVLGSAGSVIPLFQRQIERGGPVTVTHPEVTRYFMSIPEAAQLILQAGSMGSGGELFILDMGTPIKIVDMARDLIRLSGKEPDIDIPIVFTGIRPGEKLYEELITEGEGIVRTHHEKIRVIKPTPSSTAAAVSLLKHLPDLHRASDEYNADAIREYLCSMVPEYTPLSSASVLPKS
jgi:FlaA1/EpsC-like NDP-sugar epimerase